MENNIENNLKNVDIMSVANSAASSFFGVLSKDEIANCVVNAIWKAGKKYDKKHNTKFTSYVHNGVVLECLNQKRLNQRRKEQKVTDYLSIPDKRNYFEGIDMKDLIDTVCDDPTLIVDKFYKNMTIKEIAQNRGVCGETIRIRLRKNLESLRTTLSK
jgi:DNA-directed RNA polymerase specialized sigma subunit